MENHILDENLGSNLDRKSIARINNVKIFVNAKIRDVKVGRGTLIVIGVFLILASFINIQIFGEVIAHSNPAESLPKAIIYILCAIGISFKPRLSLIIGFSFFLLVQAYYALNDASSIFNWILVKIPIIYFLVNGIIACSKLSKISEELLSLGVPMNEIDLIKKLKEVPRT